MSLSSHICVCYDPQEHILAPEPSAAEAMGMMEAVLAESWDSLNTAEQ